MPGRCFPGGTGETPRFRAGIPASLKREKYTLSSASPEGVKPRGLYGSTRPPQLLRRGTGSPQVFRFDNSGRKRLYFSIRPFLINRMNCFISKSGTHEFCGVTMKKFIRFSLACVAILPVMLFARQWHYIGPQAAVAYHNALFIQGDSLFMGDNFIWTYYAISLKRRTF